MEPIVKNSTTKKRRKFDKTFKCDIVRNWLSSGKSAAVIAEEFGISESLLFAWRKLLPPTEAGANVAAEAKKPVTHGLEAKLEAARRERQHLREQCDILRKSLGLFSEPSQ